MGTRDIDLSKHGDCNGCGCGRRWIVGSCQWEMQWHTPSPQTQCACIRLTRDKYRVSLKKGTLVVFVLFLF